jgi:hypothetical protein
MALEVIEYIANGLLDVFSMDLSYFETVIPVTGDIVDIIIVIGWALLLGNLVFQAAKSIMTGLGFEGEDPRELFTRTFVFAFFLLASRQICEIGLGISNTAINLLQVPSSVTVTMPEENAFAIGASWLLVIIVGFVLMWQIVKLFFEIGERYFLVGLLTLLAPLAFATGGSKSTADIFKGWARMYGSMCLMMVLNVIFLKMFISAMGFIPDGAGVIPWLIFVVAIARVARKIDSVIARIGLNPAITGDGLGRGLPGMLSYMVIKSVASGISKAAGSAAGKAKTPPANSPPKAPHTAAASFAGNRADAGGQSAVNKVGAKSSTNTQNTGASVTSANTAQQTKGTGEEYSGSAGTSPASTAPSSGNSDTAAPATYPFSAGGSGMAGTGQPGSAGQQTQTSQVSGNSRRTSVTQTGSQRGQAFRPSDNGRAPSESPLPGRFNPPDAAGTVAAPGTPIPVRFRQPSAAGTVAASGASAPGINGAATLHPPIPRSQQTGQNTAPGVMAAGSQGDGAAQRPARFSAVPPGAPNSGVKGTGPGAAGKAPNAVSSATGAAGTARSSGGKGSSMAQQGGASVSTQQTNINASQSGVQHESSSPALRVAAAAQGQNKDSVRNTAAPGAAGTESRRSSATPDRMRTPRNSTVAPTPGATTPIQSTAPSGGREHPTTAGTPNAIGNPQARQEGGPQRTDSSRITRQPTSGAAGKTLSQEAGPVKKPDMSQSRPFITSLGITTRSPIDNTPKRTQGKNGTRKNRKDKGGQK